MDSRTIIWIIVAVVAVMAIVLLLWSARQQREVARRARTEEARERLRQQGVETRRRESIAAETEARARAAQAEAQLKAAEAERLLSTAEGHRTAASASREELQRRQEQMESLDGSAHAVRHPEDVAGRTGDGEPSVPAQQHQPSADQPRWHPQPHG